MVAAQAIEAHLFADPVAVRVPAAVSFSLVLHIAGMAGFLWLAEKKAKVEQAVISDVELLGAAAMDIDAITTNRPAHLVDLVARGRCKRPRR